MEITTIAMRATARAGDGDLMDARLRVLAPTHLPVRGSTGFVGGAALVPAYRTTDVERSASERPPV